MDVGVDGHAVEIGRRIARGKGTRDGITLSFTQSDLGEGEVKAVLVRDSVCIGGKSAVAQSCVDMAVLAAYRMEERPFRYMPSDGVIGLGLSGLSASPLCNFIDRLLEGSTGVLPQFGLLLDEHRGELHLGGHDLARMAAPLQWFPVDHPEAGFWQVAIKAVRVGNLTVDDCRRGCHGIVDSAVSRLGVQSSKFHAMRSALTSMSHHHGVCQGPDLTFDLGDMSLTLRAQDYGDTNCVPLLGSLNLDEPEFVGVYTFGETVLRRYYAAFDWELKKVGFAPLRADDSKSIASATAGSATPEGASSATALLVF